MTNLPIPVESRYRPEWISEDFVNFCLGHISSMLTWHATKASVSGIRKLPDNMVEVTLTPNRSLKRHMKQHQAGQFVLVSVPINGVNEQRAYSIVNAPEESTKQVVLAAKVQGKVSGYLANNINIGDVIDISQPQGEFVVRPNDSARLFIAAGSGITPILSMLSHELERTNIPTQLIYISRDPVYVDTLNALALEHPHFTLHLIQDSAENPARFGKDMLNELEINPEHQQTYLCGAPSLMNAVNALWEAKGISNLLTQERFGVASANRKLVEDAESTSYRVNFRQKQHVFDASGSLLASAEAAGLNPASGCRMGICNTCVCRKVSGSVRNQLTGEVSNRPNESIKLCITEAMSPLEIDA